MLKNIPKNISPELLKILSEMGHGDEIVIGDGNFPGASHANKLVRCDTSNVPDILDAILALFPLDQYVTQPAAVMENGLGESEEPPIWNKYREIIEKHDRKEFSNLEKVERFTFYKRARAAYAIVTTCEEAIYANIILKKGVIT